MSASTNKHKQYNYTKCIPKSGRIDHLFYREKRAKDQICPATDLVRLDFLAFVVRLTLGWSFKRKSTVICIKRLYIHVQSSIIFKKQQNIVSFSDIIARSAYISGYHRHHRPQPQNQPSLGTRLHRPLTAAGADAAAAVAHLHVHRAQIQAQTRGYGQ